MKFEELQIGQSAEATTVVTDAMVRSFADVSGDRNPVHLDEAYASQTRFKGRIAHGALILSFISALIANRLPGAGSIYLEQNARFVGPVHIDDTVLTRVEVKDLNEERKVVSLLTQSFVGENMVVDGTASVKLI